MACVCSGNAFQGRVPAAPARACQHTCSNRPVMHDHPIMRPLTNGLDLPQNKRCRTGRRKPRKCRMRCSDRRSRRTLVKSNRRIETPCAAPASTAAGSLSEAPPRAPPAGATLDRTAAVHRRPRTSNRAAPASLSPRQCLLPTDTALPVAIACTPPAEAAQTAACRRSSSGDGSRTSAFLARAETVLALQQQRSDSEPLSPTRSYRVRCLAACVWLTWAPTARIPDTLPSKWSQYTERSRLNGGVCSAGAESVRAQPQSSFAAPEGGGGAADGAGRVGVRGGGRGGRPAGAHQHRGR